MRCDPVALGRLLAGVVLAGAAASWSACLPTPLPDDDEAYVPPAPAPACHGDNDGTITAAELPVVTGVVARYRIGADVAVDVDGSVDDEGVVVWDLSRPDPQGEPVASLAAEPMAGQWFADLFPQAGLAAPLSADSAQLGPLVIDDDGWRLLGAASSNANPAEGLTRVVYDQPTTLYPLPLSEGATARSTSRADDALLLGVPTSFVDETTVTVVRRGRVILPDLVLYNTLQVTVRLRRTLVAGDVQQVSHHFVHECLGEVARFVSPAAPLSQPLDDDFAVAQEVWRLSL
ncbi:MAG: hypothetical protein FJ137_09995 [Deltaproteobacteria bacterium]|nr:hypothetical protein [Deltaproteobacteria bacterium]